MISQHRAQGKARALSRPQRDSIRARQQQNAKRRLLQQKARTLSRCSRGDPRISSPPSSTFPPHGGGTQQDLRCSHIASIFNFDDSHENLENTPHFPAFLPLRWATSVVPS